MLSIDKLDISKLTYWIYRSLLFFFITYPGIVEFVDLPYIGHHHFDGSVEQTGKPQDGAGAVRRGHVVTLKIQTETQHDDSIIQFIYWQPTYRHKVRPYEH